MSIDEEYEQAKTDVLQAHSELAELRAQFQQSHERLEGRRAEILERIRRDDARLSADEINVIIFGDDVDDTLRERFRTQQHKCRELHDRWRSLLKRRNQQTDG